MNCPTCKTVTLAIAERRGIEIDYCPSCRGVWLDRGELDKLIESGDAWERDVGTSPHDDDRSDDDDRGGGFLRRGSSGRKGKRESIFSELFEFGG